MDRAGDEFLARAALARDHHRRVAVRHAADHLEHLLHGLGLAHDAVLVLLDGELRLERRGGAHLALRFERASTTTFRLKGSDSLRMKSYAPSFIDSITDCVVPNALVSTTMAFGSFWRTLGEQFQPAVRLQVRFRDEQVGVLGEIELVGPRRPATRGQHAGGRRFQLVRRPLQEVHLGIDDDDGLHAAAGATASRPFLQGAISALTVTVIAHRFK